MPRRTIWSVLAAALLCLVMLPVTALAAAPSGQVIYVGNVNVTSGGYWTTGNDGTVTAFTGEGTPADNFIHYDATNNVLTLHNAAIKKGFDYSESIQGGTYIHGSAIGVFHQNGAAELTIQLEGTNTIAEVSTGIYVLASSNSTGDASLTITGSGSLDTSGSYNPAIRVQSNGGNATLSIENAKVTATASSSGDGVLVQSKNDSSVSLTVDGGSLTATGSGNYGAGIQLLFGSGDSGSGTPSLNVSNNAIVRASGDAGGIATNSTAATPSGTGIVFDGGTGTVYGSVTLQEDLEIGEGESLTIPDGSSLVIPNDKTLTVNGGALTGDVTGTVIYKVTSVSLNKDSLSLEPGGSEALTATVTPDNATNKNVTWSSSAEGVATVDANGNVTAVAQGTATITVTAADGSGVKATCSVTVSAPAAVPVESVSLNKIELTLTEGDSETLTATIAPTDATNQKVTWSSNAPGVATVDADGKVTAVAEGAATITVTTEDGNKTATCTVTVEHDPAGAWSSDADGHWHECAACGDRLDYAGHARSVENEKKATCTEEGYTGDTVCSVCGYVIEKGETIPAAGHAWGAWGTTEPATCTEDGLEARTCAACGRTQTRTVPATGHSFTNYVSNGDATCTEDGTETATCDNGCGATDTRADEGSALGHAWGEPSWRWSDDGSSATATFTCKNEPEHVQRPEVAVSSEVLLAPTCTEAGMTRYAAAVELGGQTYTSTKDVADIPAMDHSFTSYASNHDATCTEDGTETAACDNGCGATDTRADEGSALGHELGRIDALAATCTEPGACEHWECARCDALFADEGGTTSVNTEELVLPATGHSPATAWSSDESGHWHACENGCGTRLDAAAHEPETTGEKDATCTDEGYTGDMTCATCGYVIAKGEKVPATGHSWDAWDVTEPATCTEDGLETRACEACGEEESRSVPALGHDWGEPEWSWSEDGTSFVATFACAHDASHVTELMAKPASEVVSEPTCTEPGVTRYYAEVKLDGVTYAAESTAANVPALGHDFENGTCAVCGAKDEGYVAPEEPKDPEQTPVPVEPEPAPAEPKPEDSKPEVKPSDPEPTVPETGDATASFSLALGILGAAALGAGALARRRG